MKYFIVVGEASGDLHASNLMRALKNSDPQASFVFVGGPLMRALNTEWADTSHNVSSSCILRSEDLAYMGVIDVLLHYKDIRRGASVVRQSLLETQPDVVICVDYPGFNFRYVMPYVREHLPSTKLIYYIAPKVWAWKKGRIRTLRQMTHKVLCIFPFETEYFKTNQLPQAEYIGNPSLDAIKAYQSTHHSNATPAALTPYIAILSGSRKGEIRANLPLMLRVAKSVGDYRIVIAAAPGVEPDLYQEILGDDTIEIVYGDTYGVVRDAKAALVTSGTATLETALLGTPQVVCYAVRGGRLANIVFEHFFSIPYISLVNLVAGRQVVQELFGGLFTFDHVRSELDRVLHDPAYRQQMINAYRDIWTLLDTSETASSAAANRIISIAQCASY